MIFRDGCSPQSSRSVSIPSLPGMRMSVTTKSICCFCNRANPSLPSCGIKNSCFPAQDLFHPIPSGFADHFVNKIIAMTVRGCLLDWLIVYRLRIVVACREGGFEATLSKSGYSAQGR
jgi:hypothetical protein